MLILVAVHGPDKGRVLMLPEDRRHLVGRHCLSLSDRKVSRRHARLEFYRGTWTIEDLGSTNGTFVNREAVRGAKPLEAGDRIRIGKTDFMFSLSRDEYTAPRPSARRASVVMPRREGEAADAVDEPIAPSQAGGSFYEDEHAGVPVACAEWADLVRGYRPPRQPLWPMGVAAVLMAALVLGNVIVYDAWTGQRVSALPASATTAVQRERRTEPAPSIVADQAEAKATQRQAEQTVLSALRQVTRDEGEAKVTGETGN
jgi:predicted component of type VI protein secretion system